jgi:hypothetical protein
MPRYFFDIHDGEHFAPDNTGVELEDLRAAKDEAKKALPDIVVVVKDEGGHELLRATLSLAVESPSQGSAAKS